MSGLSREKHEMEIRKIKVQHKLELEQLKEKLELEKLKNEAKLEAYIEFMLKIINS